MGWFSKKATEPKMAPCPLCGQDVECKGDALADHCTDMHVYPIREVNGGTSGQYTWDCLCGPSLMKWPGSGSGSGLFAYHLARVHEFPLPFDDTLMVFDYAPEWRRFRTSLG